MMNRVLGLSSIKSMEKFKSLHGSSSGAVNTKMLSSSSFASSDSVSAGSFANLKLTAEKLVREQASTKTDLDLTNSKLKKLTEQILILEEKLQSTLNENAKLKVKQNEDEKLWKGLESKFSSTKALCDQLTETLVQLNNQAQNAEKDKVFFEDKLSSTSILLDKLQEDIMSLSSRLDSLEEIIRTRDKELMELGLAKEKVEAHFKDEQNKAECRIQEKDGTINQLKEDLAANKMVLDSLTSNMQKLHLEMGVKEDCLLKLSVSQENLEKEKLELLSSNNDLANRLEITLQEIKNLEGFINVVVEKLAELENQSLTVSDNIIQLNALHDSSLELSQQEKDLATKCAQQKFDQMQNNFTSVVSEKNALLLVNHELSSKLLELQKEQEFSMVQHAEECRLAEEKIQKLEYEAEGLVSRSIEMQGLIDKLEINLRISSENSRLSDKKMEDLLLNHSVLEKETKDIMDGLKADILKRQSEIDHLQQELNKSEEKIESLEKRIHDLENALEEKIQIVLELTSREKQIEGQKAEILASLAEIEIKLDESKKQYDHMLESKNFELSKHLKEISQRNDQAINDIWRKYEVEKQEIINLEKQKADQAIQDMEKQCEEKITEYKEESGRHLLQIQEEHAASICNIEQAYSTKEMSLISKHNEELKHSETELREKIKSLRSEHEAQIRALRCEHEDECRRLQEELNMQKAKEEKQRALLQLQCKVMGGNAEEDQEVTSKKNYFFSSAKRRNRNSDKRIQHALDRAEDVDKESSYRKATQSPLPNLMENVDNTNIGSPLNLPAQSREVIRHEYEIETSNGRTITKRRKTKSTVMFAEPRKPRARGTPKVKTPKEVQETITLSLQSKTQVVKSGAHPKPSSIGDLFKEGSLNPYADDPYAFD